MLADRQRVGNEAFALDDVECRERRRAGYRPAAEGAPEITGCERFGEAGGGNDRANGESAGQPFGEGECIRRHAE